jgi:hypothetical protein
MLWQYIIIGIVIAVALAYLGRVLWRSTKGCGGGCGCAGKNADATVTKVTIIPEEQLKIRQR